jgi:Tol biopolymer transport system component
LHKTPSLPEHTDLFFASSSTPALLAAQLAARDTQGRIANTQQLTAWQTPQDAETTAQEPSSGHDLITQVGGVSYCPGSDHLAVEMHFGVRPTVLLLDMKEPAAPTLSRLVDQGSGTFLGWHPDCQQALVRAEEIEVTDPGLWLVDLSSKTHTRITIPDLVAPEGLLAAAFSPDGSQIVYATSKGMGFGSQIWSFDLATKEYRLLREDEQTVVSTLSWSPDGSRIAFTILLDSPVPFAEAGLWQMQADGANPQFLAKMDGGRGQQPVWSHDGQQLLFVARDNPDNAAADYDSAALVSSIQAVDVGTGESSLLVGSSNARQLDLTLLPNGDLLFVSDRPGDAQHGKALELWLRTADGQLQQLTADGQDKRHPVYVPADAQK